MQKSSSYPKDLEAYFKKEKMQVCVKSIVVSYKHIFLYSIIYADVSLSETDSLLNSSIHLWMCVIPFQHNSGS